MNKTDPSKPNLEILLKQTLKDDLPKDAEDRMSRRFLSLKQALGRPENPVAADYGRLIRGLFRKDIIAVASAVMLILGIALQLNGSQTVLARSIEQLKVITTISMGLNRASSMDCMVQMPIAEDEQISCRVRWNPGSDVRVDVGGDSGSETLWIPNEMASAAGPKFFDGSSMPIDAKTTETIRQLIFEFGSPEIVARHIEDQYGMMQGTGRIHIGTNEFLIVGRESKQDIEITVDAETYLPVVLRKYSKDPDSTNEARSCSMEARFIWNQPMSERLFSPRTPTLEQ